MTHATCKHAASGCNYPEGECAGLCSPLANSEVRARIELEGTVFELTRGADDLAEHPGRIGLFIFVRWCGNSQKTYFDSPDSLRQLRGWLDQVLCAMEHLEMAGK